MSKFMRSRRGSEVGGRFIGTALAAMFAISGVAAASDGGLDPTFGSGGIMFSGVTTADVLFPPKMAVQPDGKIIECAQFDSGGSAGKDFLIVRFNADGSLDTSFNFAGKVAVDFDGNADVCTSVAVQADGKIVAIGASKPLTSFDSDFAVARLDANGTLDPSFGAGTGKTTISFNLGGNNDDYGAAIALQADGNILIAGSVSVAPSEYDFGVVRLLPDGTRDTAFNVSGRVTIAFDLPGSTANAIAVDGAGRIFVGGTANASPTAGSDFAVARLLPNGHLDTAFNVDGRATFGFDIGATKDDFAFNMILQRDGKIIMVGYADTGSGTTSNFDTAIARMLPNGLADPSFGIDGKVLVPYDLIANGGDFADGIIEDSVGRLVIGGSAQTTAAGNSQPVLARLLRNGTFDPSFGAFGKKIYDFGTDIATFTSIALQGTQIIGDGLSLVGTDQDIFAARIEVDLIFANSFE